MRLQVAWEDAASKAFDRLPGDVQERICVALARLALESRGNVRQLQGTRGKEWRLRVGEYRVRFALHRSFILVLDVFARGAGYRS